LTSRRLKGFCHGSFDIMMDINTHAQDDVKRKALEKFESRLVQ